MCETANDMLASGSTRTSTASSSASRSASRAPSPPRYEDDKAAGDFVLGGDSDDDEEAPPAKETTASPPPPPPEVQADAQADDGSREEPPAYEAGGVGLGESDGKGAREQCALHHVRKDDTLQGLAFHYGVDVRLYLAAPSSDTLAD